MSVNAPVKLRLRRPVATMPSSEDDIIQKNLESLKQHIQKKKRAQEIYYENHSESFGLSPMTRGLRQPVKQRLGRRIAFNGTNTSAIPPKQRLRRLNGTGQMNMRKSRFQSAQQRINRIRANHSTPKVIKLRRTLPNADTTPRNFKVEVMNNNAFINKNQFIRRFKQILNPQIQLEIKRIQVEFEGGQVIPPFKITPAATSLSTNDRFGCLI